MSITDIFTPKWKQAKPEVRIEAISEITDQKTLLKLALDDPNPYVRIAAKKNISDPDLRKDLNGFQENISIDDVEKLEDLYLLSIAATCSESRYIRLAAIKKINDQELLELIAKSDPDKFVRIAAVKKVKDQGVLMEVVSEEENMDVRITAIEKIDSQHFLLSVINEEEDVEIRKVAVWKLADKELLSKIADHDNNEKVRHVAQLKLKEKETGIKQEANLRQVEETLIVAQNGVINNLRALPKKQAEVQSPEETIEEDIDEPSAEELLEEEIQASLPTRLIKLNKTQRVARRSGFLNEPIKKRLSKIERKELKEALIEVVRTPSKARYDKFYNTFVEIYESPFTGSRQVKQLWEQLTQTFPELAKAIEEGLEKSLRDEEEMASEENSNRRSALETEDTIEKTPESQFEAVENSTERINNHSADKEKETAVNGKRPIYDQSAISDEDINLTSHIDQKILADIAKSEKNEVIRNSSIAKITDENLLEEILQSVDDEGIQYQILKQKKYLELMKGTASIKQQAAPQPEPLVTSDIEITEQSVLEDVALNASEKKVRKAAVEKISDQKILSKIALNDSDPEVRTAAIWEITENNILATIAKHADDFIIKKTAIRRMDDDDMLMELTKNETDVEVKITAVKSIKDQGMLKEIVFDDYTIEVREEALDHINDQKLLAAIAGKINNEYIRNLAVWAINDPSILAEVAKNADELYVRKTAVQRIKDASILTRIAKQAQDLYVRKIATEKVEEQIYLKEIALEASDMYVRKIAVDKITDMYVLMEVIKNDAIDYVRSAAVARLNQLKKA